MNAIISATPCGPIQGTILESGALAYRGIRYASAGRWEYPQRTTRWEGTYDATQFGPNAMQRDAFMPKSDTPDFYEHEFRLDLPYTWSEDCHYLNIYAPQAAQKAPVIVYIHGGAFMGGSGWDKVFEEPVWPHYGAIGVTLNYRLGIFGNMVLPELIEESGHAGNYNVYDQLAALQWIYDNIEAFGGDPENITLMGQSAGARSVQMLAGAPKAKKLLRQIVMSSGGGSPSRLFDHIPSVEEAAAFWQEWQQMLGAKSLAELRAVPAQELMDSIGKMFGKHGFHQVISFISPIFDNWDFPVPGTDSNLPNGWLDVPYLCGGTLDDIVPGLALDAKLWTAKQSSPSYSYCFSRPLPGDDKGSWHSADLWYWFGALDRCWRPFEETDYNLQNTMVAYLVNFARTGDPNGEGLPEWLSSQETELTMQLAETVRMDKVPDPAEQKGAML